MERRTGLLLEEDFGVELLEAALVTTQTPTENMDSETINILEEDRIATGG